MIDVLLASIVVLSSLAVILAKKPVYSCLSFLVTLITLALFYQQLNAPFISAMQVLVYAGAILVIFMFVIILFQDANAQISLIQPKSSPALIYGTVFLSTALIIFFLYKLTHLALAIPTPVPEEYGTIQTLGKALYIDFFFPFEAVIVLFLVAIVGAIYIGKKEK